MSRARRAIHQSRSAHVTRSALTVASLLYAASPLAAATSTWTNIVGGTFSTSANWNSAAGPVPAAADTALFNSNSAYTVNFSTSPTNTTLDMTAGNVVFAAAGTSRTYTLTAASIHGANLSLPGPTQPLLISVGSLSVFNGSTVTVSAGNDIATSSLTLGATAPSGTSTMLIDGAGSTLTVNGTTTMGSNGAVGSLTFQNNAAGLFGDIGLTNSGFPTSGASITAQTGADITTTGNLSFGPSNLAGQATSVTVTGAGSTFVQTGATTLTLGSSSSSTSVINVLAAATFTTGTGLTTVNPTGVITVDAGTFNANGNITLAGGTLTQAATPASTFNWAPSRTMTIQSAGHANFAGTFITPNNAVINLTGAGSQLNVNTPSAGSADLQINNGAALTASAGAAVTSAGLFQVGAAGTGTATFDGAGTSLSVPSLVNVGNNATGTLTFSNGAAASVGNLAVGNGTGNAILNVQSAAVVAATNSIQVSSDNASATAAVNINGGILSASTGAFVSIGSFSTGTATVNITGNGTLATNTGGLSISPTGSLTITNGQLNANGDIFVFGGSLTQAASASAAFNWQANHTMNIQGAGKVNLTNTFTTPTNAIINIQSPGSQLSQTASADISIANNAQLNVTSGGSVVSTGFFDIAQLGNGTATFDGIGTSLSVTNSSNFLGTVGTGVLTLRNSATGTVPGFNIGTAGGSSGTLNILSGASLALGGTNVAATNLPATGVINVTGGTLTQPSVAGLTLGASTNSTATFSLSAGGSYVGVNGIVTVNPTGSLVLNAASFQSSGPLQLVGGTASLSSASSLSVASTTFNNGSTLNITDSSASLGALTVTAGTINFVSGSLSYVGNLTVGTTGILGTNLTLDFSRSLTLTGNTTISPQHQLALTGGSLSTGTLTNNGSFLFSSGTLSLTGASGPTIGTGGPLGPTLTLSTSQTLNTSNLTTVSSTGSLYLDGGALNANGGLSNSGEINLLSPTSRLTGTTLINSKLLRGDGRADLSLNNTFNGELRADAGKRLLLAGPSNSNAGRINLLGGTAEFSSPLTNSSTGIIAGRGTLITSSLTNQGQLQLSAGTTDIFGPLTNTNASKVILSGNATATFYNNVTNNTGSEFRVSSGSTAVFFAPVTGAGLFTGTGAKFFEAGASSPDFIATSGATTVDPSATLTTSYLRESSLTVNGPTTLTPGSLTSSLTTLSIDPASSLNLTNNRLVLDVPGTPDVNPGLLQIRQYLLNQQLLSSTASADPQHRLAIAYIDNALLNATTWGDLPVDTTAILTKLTYLGDANLDGTINADDFALIDRGFRASGTAWSSGDFNYDGAITSADYLLIDRVSTQLSGTFSPDATLLAQRESQFGPAYVSELLATIPEPSSLLACVFANLLLPRRRRRRSSI